MNETDLNGITLEKSGQSIAFVFEETERLSGTGYKVLKGQDPKAFVLCVRSRINGKDKITYLIHNNLSMRDFVASSDASGVGRLLLGIVDIASALRENGFLRLQNVVFSQDCVFVDPATKAGRLICLPLANAQAMPGEELSGAREVYRFCSDALSDVMGDRSPLVGCEKSSGWLTGDLAYLKSQIRQVLRAGASKPSGKEEPPRAAEAPVERDEPKRPVGPIAAYRIMTQGLVDRQEFLIEDDAVMGKSEAKATCIVRGYPTVSRAHCRLHISQDGTLTVSDLNSSNGTFVNGARLSPGVPVRVQSGDRLRLANIEFKVMRVR